MNLLNLFKRKKSESSNSEDCNLSDMLIKLQLLQVKYCGKYHIGISTQCNECKICYISVSINVFEDTVIIASKYYSFGDASNEVNIKEYRDMVKYLERYLS